MKSNNTRMFMTLVIIMLNAVTSFAQLPVVNPGAGRTLVLQQYTVPGIATQPGALAPVCEVNGVALTSVVATGSLLNYQWQYLSTAPGAVWTNVPNGTVASGVTTASLTLTNATLAYNNYQYKVSVSGACTPTVVSNPVTLTVNANPTISTNPSNQTICAGLGTSFTIAAAGFTLAYQWQYLSTAPGAVWTNIPVGAPYAGENTNSLSISNVTGLGGFQYKCQVTGGCGVPIYSSSATLTVNSLVAISANSITHNGGAGVTAGGVCENTSINPGTIVCAVTATGTGITNQWYDNGTIIAGATGSTYTITNPTSAVNGHVFTCTVSGTCAPSQTSAPMTAVVYPNAGSPAISNDSVCMPGDLNGDTIATFNTIAGQSAYQWKSYNSVNGTWNNVAGTQYAGATTSALIVTDAITTGARYRCMMTTNNGCISNSGQATLTVNALPTNITSLAITGGQTGLVQDTAKACPGQTFTLTLNASQANTKYTVIDAATGNAISGPTNGNGGALPFAGLGAANIQIMMTKNYGLQQCRSKVQ